MLVAFLISHQRFHGAICCHIWGQIFLSPWQLCFRCGEIAAMTGEMFHKDLHLFWQDLIFLGVCLVPGKCDAADEFGRTHDRILE